MKIEKTYDIVIMTEGSDPVFNVARAVGGYKIASALRNEGYSVFVLNNFSHFIQKGNIKEILDKLIGDNTLWVGFSSTLFMRNNKDVYRKRHTRDTAKNNILWRWPTADDDVKLMTDYIQSKGVKTVYGGQMSYHRSKEVKDQIDYYVVGMGEHMALHLTDHLKNGTPLNYNPAYGRNPYILDYDQKGNLFDFRNSHINYMPEDFWNKEDGMGIEFGRGCIFKCAFCAYPLIGKKKGDLSFLRDKECIKHELQQNYDLYGVTKYVIIDDTFNEQTVKLQAIADAIDEINLPEKLQFSAFIRIDLVARWPEQLDLLKRINVRAWFLGVESLNYDSAKAIGKGCPKEKIFETVRNAKKVFDGSLSVYGSFIAGLPHDSRETMDAWIQEITDNNDVFDAYSFSPLELGTDSILSQNPAKYGYTIDTNADTENKWYNDAWSADETVEYVKHLQETVLQDIKVSTFFLMFYQCLGFTFDELRVMTFTDLFSNPLARRKARQYLEKNYYSKVENFLDIGTIQPNIRYIKNLPISRELTHKLKEEVSKKELNTPIENVLHTVDSMHDCDIANKIANHISSIVGCEVYPAYMKLNSGEYLPPRTEPGTTAIHIVLNGDGPITWDEAVDVYYDSAVLNLEKMHSIQATDTSDRTFFHISILNKSYKEVLEIIEGKEDTLFNLESVIA
tara:strand:+ start:3874 stop:5907 length:2034 start_codon:yes stop_codon:yes gene_type:complete